MKLISTTKKYISSHKVISIVAFIIIVGGGYYIYRTAFASPSLPQYVLAAVTKGTITQTVTGSGQVSAENQLDITSEVSGKIAAIRSTVGQSVKAGDLIASLDSRDALATLESAKISYAKLVKPAETGEITNSENNLTKAYSDGFSSVSSTFLDIPTILSGMRDMFYTANGYLSDQEVQGFSETGRDYRQTALTSYEKANAQYPIVLARYKTLTKDSPRTDIEKIILETNTFVSDVAEAVRRTQTAVTFISATQPDYDKAGGTAAGTSVSTWLGQINSHASSLLSAKNTIESTKDSLETLREGADALDVRSQKLSLEQSQRTYDKYFIRAPFDGVIGRIPVKVYDQAGSGTVVATLVSTRKQTTIPLNEVDAVKVAKGNRVELTFDAIAGLTTEGIVTEVDLVGTQSQGVVTYNVKIAFEGSDQRILPGMSVDATIITEEKSGILVVPSGSVKGRGAATYVEVFDTVGAPENSRGRMVTITSATPPQQIPVKVGDSDDTNTEILNGLTEGQMIVTRTIAAGAAVTAQSGTPTIFSSLGGSQRNVIRNANSPAAGTVQRTTGGTTR